MKEKKVRTTSYTSNSIGETLFFCDVNDKGATTLMGIGKVCAVQKGENIDKVILYFGTKTRPVYVVSNHARRQIYTLKRGQYCWFLGYLKGIKDRKNGKMKPFIFALGFLAWYVPKMVDIEKYDVEELEKLEEENANDLSGFLDEILEED